MKNKNILLITSALGDSKHVASAPPIGLYRLKNYLVRSGVHCDILDLDMDSIDEYLKSVGNGIYDVIGFSVSHYNMRFDLDNICLFRKASEKSKKNCIFIAGGQEAVLNYQQWLDCGIDIIFLGFAEKSLYEFCSHIPSNNSGKISEIVKDTDGVAFYNEAQKLIYRPSKSMRMAEFQELSFYRIKELDIPYKIYWDKLDAEVKHFNFNKNKFITKTVRLYTTSHCPRKCGFCSSQAFIPTSQQCQSPIYMLSADDIFELILFHIDQYGAQGFLFSDDDLLVGTKAGLKRIFQLCELIIDAKLKGLIPEDITFNCQARIADFLLKPVNGRKRINNELMQVLKRAGFHGFGLGVETFSNRLLKCPSVNKIGINESNCCHVLDALLEHGLVPTINIILGIPESTEEDIIYTMTKTAEYALKGCQFVVTEYLKSFPGAPIYQNNDFTIKTEAWRNPFNGKRTDIEKYFIPVDPVIADILDRIEEQSIEELEYVKKNSPWTDSIVPKSISGLSVFLAFSRLLGRKDLIDYFNDVIKIISSRIIANPQTD